MTTRFEQLSLANRKEIAAMASHLNPGISIQELETYVLDMFGYSHYFCFGLYNDKDQLLALSGGWMTTRFYSGKQLEVDHVIVEPELQAQGIGRILFGHIEAWAKQQGCRNVELNTYIQNSGSHKFYFNQGYRILGFHFQKAL